MITLKIVLEDKKEQLQAEQYFKTQPQIDLYIEEKADKEQTGGGEEFLLRNGLVLSDMPQVCTYYIEKKAAVVAILKDGRDYPGVRYAVTAWQDAEEDYLEKVYQRYHGLPWSICETKRCFIRETTVDDLEAFYKMYKERSITKYMEDLFEDPEEERQYIRDYRDKVYAFYGFGMWTVCLKETGEVIGRAGLSMREGFEDPELGYMIAVPWQKKGLAEEVCREILQYGKDQLGFEKIQVLMEAENTASEHLCRKLGFQFVEKQKIEKTMYDRYLLRY